MSMPVTRRNIIRIMSASAFNIPMQSIGGVEPFSLLRFGVIGFGEAGEILCEQLLKRNRQVVISAICDIWGYKQKRGEALVKRLSGTTPALYLNYEEMLSHEKNNLDAVIISTPDWVHEIHVIACLDVGLHVFCESPLAHTSQSAKRILKAANNTNRIFQYSSVSQINPVTKHIKDHFIEGERIIGPLVTLESEIRSFPGKKIMPKRLKSISNDILKKYGYLSDEALLNWRFIEKYSLGYDLSWVVEQVDFFRHMLSANPVALVASGGVCNDTSLAKAIYVTFEFKKGEKSIWCRSCYLPVNNGRNIINNKVVGLYGCVQYTSLKSYIQKINSKRHFDVGDEVEIYSRWRTAYEEGLLGTEEKQEKEMNGYIPQTFARGHTGRFILPFNGEKHVPPHNLDDFARSIRQKKIIRGTAFDGFASMVIAEAVRESMNTKKWIRFNDEVFNG